MDNPGHYDEYPELTRADEEPERARKAKEPYMTTKTNIEAVNSGQTEREALTEAEIIAAIQKATGKFRTNDSYSFEDVWECVEAAVNSRVEQRCQCCGYLVTESEHRGCLRAAAPQGLTDERILEEFESRDFPTLRTELGTLTPDALSLISGVRALLAEQSPAPASPSGEDAAEQAAAPMAAFSEEQVYKVAIWLAKKDGVEDDDLHRLIWEGNPPEPWGEVWNRYEDDARELLAHIDAPLARDNEQATDVPVAVFAQPDGEDPMRFGDRSLDASVKRLTEAYCVQQPSPVPDQMALVWRFDIGRLRNDWLRLRSLTGSPASEQADEAVNLEGLRAKLLAPRQIVRDGDGYLTHPDFPVCDEGTHAGKLLEAFGIEVEFVSMESDDPEGAERYFEAGEPDCSYWTPTQPEGTGWVLLEIYDTEDGPYAMFGRDLYEAEQARKRENTKRLAESVRATLAKEPK